MTPKEKAYDIWQKMMLADLLVDSISAKQCALVAVEELIEHDDIDDYWIEVKQELEKL
jgi:hypothetical protein